MKILISIPWFKPAFKAGGPIQSIDKIIKYCHEEFRFFILCSDQDLDGSALSASSKNQFLSYSENCSVAYLSKQGSRKNFKRLFNETNPNVLYVIGIYRWQFMFYPLFLLSCPRKIISVRGMLHPGALTQKKWKKTSPSWDLHTRSVCKV